MEEPVYFSKIEYQEHIGPYCLNVLFLNLKERELSYQVFERKEHIEQKEIFSYGIKLTDEQLNNLLPYCNALEFEPFRNKKMSMNDEGYIGYRDESKVYFRAITDSYIPMIELPMDYYYDEQHIWPNEKLYKYLIETFFENNKKTRKWVTPYGGCSLFC